MPIVKKFVSDTVGKEAESGVDPMEAVARGFRRLDGPFCVPSSCYAPGVTGKTQRLCWRVAGGAGGMCGHFDESSKLSLGCL